MNNDIIYQNPLDWPSDWPRCAVPKSGNSRYSKKGTGGRMRPWSVSAAGDELFRELKRLGAVDCIITTDMALRKDGLISGNQSYSINPAVSVFFTLEARPLVMANDSFLEPANNIRQLTIALQNMRHLSENGGAVMKDRAFRGFTALPAPMTGGEPWYSVMNLSPDASADEIKARYRSMAKQRHSDSGGDNERMSALNVARDEALAVRN